MLFSASRPARTARFAAAPLLFVFALRIAASEMVLVQQGQPQAVVESGPAWRRGAGWIEGAGTGNFLYAAKQLGAGDFTITARFSLEKLDGTAASLVFGENHFGFDGRGHKLFLEGADFGPTRTVGTNTAFITPGQPVEAQVIRAGARLRLRLAGQEIATVPFHTNALGPFGLRPWRASMRVYEFAASGNLVDDIAPPAETTGLLGRTNLFVSGREGYHTYRIPSLLVTARGTLLAFAEGRKASGGDAGDIDLVLKRSSDAGRTWQPRQTVWDDSTNTCGNPCPVLDRDTGTIWLLLTWNRGEDHEGKIIAQQSKDTRRVFVTSSTDDGRTWAKPRDITADVKPTNWTWYATGPGAGVQMEHGPHAGRLVIPCDHTEAGTKRMFSHVLYSDDHGRTWQLGGSTPQDKVNECEVVELSGGRLLLNMRNYDRVQHARQTAISSDGGATWSDQRHATELVEPICQGSIRRHSWPAAGRQSVVLFANPASAARRERLTVRASFDEAQSWPASRLLDPRPSAYSCLAVLPDGTVGILYEAGRKSAYENLVFARFDLEWLTAPPASSESEPERTDLFESGESGYALYHIPGLVVTAKGTVLAWCEARKKGSDWDAIDILLRRSTDDGKTWSTPQKIADVPGPKTKNPFALALKFVQTNDVTYNNPVLIADRDGTVHGLFCLEYMRCFSMKSTDDGLTWSAPVEITEVFEKFHAAYAWKVLATGPDHGLQLQSGRLLVPVWLSTGTGGNAHRPSVTATIYSDDRGQTWHAGDIAVPCTAEWINPNETVAVQLADGSVMLNVRNESKTHRRLVTASPDGATGWSTPRFDDALLEPICMGSMIRLSAKPESDRNRLLFCNPDNLARADGQEAPGKNRDRKNLSVKLSYDEGRTWAVNKAVDSGYSGYSDLAVTKTGAILCFYGRGTRTDYGGFAFRHLTLARFSLDWLTGGQDHLSGAAGR